jgi:hypothetical protein
MAAVLRTPQRFFLLMKEWYRQINRKCICPSFSESSGTRPQGSQPFRRPFNALPTRDFKTPGYVKATQLSWATCDDEVLSPVAPGAGGMTA